MLIMIQIKIQIGYISDLNFNLKSFLSILYSKRQMGSLQRQVAFVYKKLTNISDILSGCYLSVQSASFRIQRPVCRRREYVTVYSQSQSSLKVHVCRRHETKGKE